MTDSQEIVISGFLWGAELSYRKGAEAFFYLMPFLLCGFILKMLNSIKFKNIFLFKKYHSCIIANWKCRKSYMQTFDLEKKKPT